MVLVAAALRVALVLHVRASNPAGDVPQLDDDYYLQWIREIAAGDVLGRRGIVNGDPWFLNPLYAYVMAPVAALLDEPRTAIHLLQALLGAATAGLAAAAADRWFGRLGAWTAGLLVAFAAPLAQLDAHLSVAELGAFLVAGACFAAAPPREGASARGHGPVAAGLWLGIGALARPIPILALPFFAWLQAGRTGRGVRAAAVVVGVFLACAVPTFLRNALVAGEPVLYTAAGGVNAHLGNNPASRDLRTMVSDRFRFSPILMHDDARRHVAQALGRVPTRSEVGDWFWRITIDEALNRPAESAEFYANKARWFLTPVEVTSSASFWLDRHLAPGLWAAFVPTWLVGALGLAGAWFQRKRRDLLLGPGSLVLAHWATLTLVFPLSHYRAPAIPALAILAAGAVAFAVERWSAGRRGAAAAVAAVAWGLALLGALPPQPDRLEMRDLRTLAARAADRGDEAEAMRLAREAAEAFVREHGREASIAWLTIGELQFRFRRYDEAEKSLLHSLEIDPGETNARVALSHTYEAQGRFAEAVEQARMALRKHRASNELWARLGVALSKLPGGDDEAREAILTAMRLGFVMKDQDLVRRLGIVIEGDPPPPPSSFPR